MSILTLRKGPLIVDFLNSQIRASVCVGLVAFRRWLFRGVPQVTFTALGWSTWERIIISVDLASIRSGHIILNRCLNGNNNRPQAVHAVCICRCCFIFLSRAVMVIEQEGRWLFWMGDIFLGWCHFVESVRRSSLVPSIHLS